MNYQEFIKSKTFELQNSGFEISESGLNPMLFPFQKFVIKRALMKGRHAAFLDCGMGKTFIQLEWAKKVVEHTNRDVLILAPLAVSGQTIDEGIKFGIPVKKLDLTDSPGQIHITNYEQLANIPASYINSIAGVILDESSILKNFTGKMKGLIIQLYN